MWSSIYYTGEHWKRDPSFKSPGYAGVVVYKHTILCDNAFDTQSSGKCIWKGILANYKLQQCICLNLFKQTCSFVYVSNLHTSHTIWMLQISNHNSHVTNCMFAYNLQVANLKSKFSSKKLLMYKFKIDNIQALGGEGRSKTVVCPLYCKKPIYSWRLPYRGFRNSYPVCWNRTIGECTSLCKYDFRTCKYQQDVSNVFYINVQLYKQELFRLMQNL